MEPLHKKYQDLLAHLRSLESVAVAFSGGVDSTFLLRCAHDTLGDRVLAVTASSCSFPERERMEAQSFCKENSIRHMRFDTGAPSARQDKPVCTACVATPYPLNPFYFFAFSAPFQILRQAPARLIKPCGRIRSACRLFVALRVRRCRQPRRLPLPGIPHSRGRRCPSGLLRSPCGRNSRRQAT